MKNLSKVIIFSMVLLTSLLLINLARPSAEELITTQRQATVDTLLIFDQIQGDFGTLYFSEGKVDQDNNTLYFADEIVTTPFSRAWSSGGGHSHFNLRSLEAMDRQYFFSAQYLGADGNMTKGLFGILKDTTIKSIFTNIDDERISAQIIPIPDTDERLYFIAFDQLKVDTETLRYTGVIFNVNYEGEPSKQFFIAPAIFESEGKDVAYIDKQ